MKKGGSRALAHPRNRVGPFHENASKLPQSSSAPQPPLHSISSLRKESILLSLDTKLLFLRVRLDESAARNAGGRGGRGKKHWRGEINTGNTVAATFEEPEQERHEKIDKEREKRRRVANMPPKPFNPPRPSTSTPSAPKAKGRPKGSTNKAKDSTSTSKTSNGVKKSTKSLAGNGKAKSGDKGARLSAASIRSLLPSLSPDTSDVETSSVPGDAGEDSDDPFASQPRPSTSKSRRPSTTNQARIKKEEEDAHAAGLDERDRKSVV